MSARGNEALGRLLDTAENASPVQAVEIERQAVAVDLVAEIR